MVWDCISLHIQSANEFLEGWKGKEQVTPAQPGDNLHESSWLDVSIGLRGSANQEMASTTLLLQGRARAMELGDGPVAEIKRFLFLLHVPSVWRLFDMVRVAYCDACLPVTPLDVAPLIANVLTHMRAHTHTHTHTHMHTHTHAHMHTHTHLHMRVHVSISTYIHMHG